MHGVERRSTTKGWGIIETTADEFDRQVGALIGAGIPAVLGVSDETLARSLNPLRVAALEVKQRGTNAAPGVDFVVVPALTMGEAEQVVPLLRLAGSAKPGVLDRNHGPEGLRPYAPLHELGVPEAGPYLLVDVERGEEFCDVRPGDAVAEISARGRSPLTIAEGLALQVVHPHLLAKNRCFMLAGSRRGDRRVPALWISAGAPKLGWCWEGNPHSWLGTASAARRVSAGDEAPA